MGIGKRFLASWVALCLLGLTCRAAQDAITKAELEKDRAQIVDGVGPVAAPGVPGALIASGPKSVALVVGERDGKRAPIAVAGHAGSGRMVGFSHSGYLDAGTLDKGDTARLFLNALRWAAGASGKTQAGPRVLLIGCNLAEYLKGKGLRATPLQGAAAAGKLADYDVIVCSKTDLSDADVQALAKFTKSGGGIVAAQTGWGWQQLSGGKPMHENKLNQLFAVAGIAWSNATVGHTAGDGYDAKEKAPPACQAFAALDLVVDLESRKPAQSELDQAFATLELALATLPERDPWLAPRIDTLIAKRGGPIVMTHDEPLAKERVLDRFLVRMENTRLTALAPQQVRAHPAALHFPGPCPDGATVVTKKLTIDLKVPAWHGTGLYAAPGALITVDLAKDALAKKLTLRIGAHTDSLFGVGDPWRRWPEISRSFALDSATTPVASAFGGAIFIEVPEGTAPGSATLIVRGAIEAPRFVLGETSLDEWKSTIRSRPAPWAELESSKIALSVESKDVRELDDPEALMRFWDQIADAMADFGAQPRTRLRAERYAADEQISAGYMHSGYPIMTHLDASPWLASLEALQKGNWGLLHELGHNHQRGEWTFDGTGEVTNNVFALFVLDTVCQVKSYEAHNATANLDLRVQKYLEDGASFDTWKQDPFLALAMYQQLAEGFGWDAFKRVFAEYRTAAQATLPKNDDEKRDQWMVRFSRAVGKNLGPFFEAWRVPTSEKARASIANLPAWMPEGFPPAGK